jgi:PAS domain S-box-containing protein
MDLTEDIRDMRRCVRDLLALTALSVYWSRSDFSGVAEGLADVLLRTVPAALVLVRVNGAAPEAVVTVVRSHQAALDEEELQQLERDVDAAVRNAGLHAAPTISDPFGDDGSLRLAIHPIGYEGDSGVVVVAAPQPTFPSQTDTLLLSAAANQAAIVLQHRRAEQVLKASEERFRSLCACSPMGIFMTDTWGHCTYTNPSCQAICGFTYQEALGEGWVQYVHPEDREIAVREWLATSRTGQEFSSEFRFQNPDGRTRWAHVRASPMLSEKGQLLGHVGTVEDITERKWAEEELQRQAQALREADRRKDEFLATLAHELRNPLAPIRNGLQLIRLAGSNAALMDQARSMMDRQLQQMVRLIDDLLDVSRITRGRIELRRERVELASIIQVAVESNRPLIEACEHELIIDIPVHSICLEADQARLAQVFSNLLNNAAKYTEHGGTIRLSVERRDDWAVVKIRDSGVGIPSEMLSSIFEMFTQVDRSLEKRQGGLGIGLTLAKQLVEMHGGTIVAGSAGAERGSEFTVALPLAPSQDSTRDAALETTALPVSARRRILVADDNRDSATSMALMLRLGGNDVRTAYDGGEAVLAAREFQPSVVLLDIGMPKLNGYDAARRLRGESWGRNLVLIALTGWGQAEDKQKALDAGFDYHLTKPVDPQVLEKLLAEIQEPQGQ